MDKKTGHLCGEVSILETGIKNKHNKRLAGQTSDTNKMKQS